jgi:hypothetical protein
MTDAEEVARNIGATIRRNVAKAVMGMASAALT